MSNQNVSHAQLALWRTAKEIKDNVTSSADPGGSNLKSLWKDKLDESKVGAIRNARYVPTRQRKGASLYDSIKREGVREPVQLVHHLGNNSSYPKGLQIGEGHHRVAAAHDIDPNMLIPVHEELHGDKDHKWPDWAQHELYKNLFGKNYDKE